MRGWKSEREFVERFLDSLGSEKKGTCIVREFRTGYGLPDIVLTEYLPKVVERRKKHMGRLHVGAFTVDCAYAMSYLANRRWVRLKTLKNAFRSRNGPFNTTLQTLIDRQIVSLKDDKIKSRPKAEVFAVKNITVIEAKIGNWRRALIQAQRYQWFTESCYVLMPEPSGIKKRQIALACKKYHVGLIFFSRERGISEAMKIRRKKPYNTYLAWLINEAIFDEVQESESAI
jgi:hypothetical protein